MSGKTKESRESPKSTVKAKDRVKPAVETSANQTRNLEGFDLGLAMTGSIRNKDIERIMSIQNKSLKSIAKTNELLGKFNDFSSSKYDVLQHMFLQHTRLLVDLKKDLTNVFLRIRHIKVRLQKQYPEAFDATFNLRQNLEDRLEQEETSEPTYVNNAKEKNRNKKGKTKTKGENVEANQGMIGNTGLVVENVGEQNNDLRSEIENLEVDKDMIEINTVLHNDPGKIHNSLSLEMEHSEICVANKTEVSTNVGTSVTSDTFECNESEGKIEDETVKGRAENAEDINGFLGEVKDSEGIKVITGEFKDQLETVKNMGSRDEKCCVGMMDGQASDIDECTRVIEEDPGGTMGISGDTHECS